MSQEHSPATLREALTLARIVVQFHEPKTEYEPDVVLKIAQALIACAPSETRRNDLELALLARAQFEGNAEGALHEMEFRVRKFLNAAPHVGAAPSMEEPQQGCLPGNPGASGQTAAGSSAPSATPRSAAADLGKLVEGWQAEEDAVNRDAARYRWLNKADNFIIEIEEIRDGLPYKHRRLKCGAVLDKWIDALIKQESADE